MINLISGYTCDGDECNNTPFIPGQVVYRSVEEDTYFCSECCSALERTYGMKFEDVVYQPNK